MLLPRPEAQQRAILIALSWIYIAFGQQPVVAGLC